MATMANLWFTSFVLPLLLCVVSISKCQDSLPNLFKIEGKITVDPKLVESHTDWLKHAQIHVDSGTYIGVPRKDGKFSVTGLPSGSYAVEVSHPTFVFDPLRVDINSKGKFRARKLNSIQPNKVVIADYPLHFKALRKAPYFQKREEWRITDMLMSPMVLMMLLPMVLLFVMPKMMNAADPETKKEMESQMSMIRSPNQQMPDLAETLTSWLGGGSAPQSKPKKKK